MKSAMTGIDPEGNFKNFIKRDPTKNIDVHRDRKFDSRHEDNVKIPVGQVPFGTTKCTYKKGLSTDGRLKREELGILAKTFPRNPTDNISSDPPAQERPFQGLFDRMVSSSKYEKNTRTNHPWVPKEVVIQTLNNRNSVTHNIISHQENSRTGALEYTQMRDAKVNRAKGLGEFNDMKRLTAINTNKDHVQAMGVNQSVFKRKDGIFTHLYNSAARFGEDKPFKA